ncbi:hypothetical protein FDP41_000456 [Naegleria fowleri]|uniref:U2A'/phosphoprotein 32 family A C-terminal domain-containing protein n=1 Tax=Naegleria fowleri TaxID=5763 RepID=A0A6A5C5I8_NAEFO|nr:uncharacterized protein FDP41_000456 [Naegleria fowleri]KAF0984557.1 hypothetical protein FDP41_000456 [Naegleria fowleri]CAG4715152.1 unnamed protein product [Naegleria fowleri]
MISTTGQATAAASSARERFNVSPYMITDNEEDGTSSNVALSFDEEDGENFGQGQIEIDYKLICTVSGQFDLGSVVNLDLNSIGIDKIKNLSRCLRLEYLDLSNNEIELIEGLENLSRLKRLSLSNNKIKKLEGVANLKNLQTLILENNLIENLSDIQELQHLTNLRSINLKGNSVCEKEGFDETLKSYCKKLQFINGEHIALRFPTLIFDEKEDSFEIPLSKSWTVDNNQNSIFTFEGFPEINPNESFKTLNEFKKEEIDCKKTVARADTIIQEVLKALR